MICRFDPSKCTTKCDKYGMCAFMEVQHQLVEISEQINGLYKAMNSLSSTTIINNNQIDELSNKLNSYTADMLELINSKSESNKGE